MYRCGLNALDEFDEVVDVRTPAEFADDHLPGATSAPVFTNAERARIGTIYKQESTFTATRLGAAIVARHIAEHLETTFADRPRTWRPLIYCWRGGKRSGAMTTWFNLIGWKARQLDGGYKAWRRHVMDRLDALPTAMQFIVLAGPTGCGKTRLLQALDAVGAQTLDLEGIACHRGSILGAMPGCPQPSQRHFETCLYAAINQFDPARPVFVEAESRNIGRCSLPGGLFEAMHDGRCVRVQAHMPQRIEFLLQDYRHLFAAAGDFKQTLQRLIGLHSRETVGHWQALIDADRRAEVFQQLVEQHYDPAYNHSSHRHYPQLAGAPVFEFEPAADDSEEQARHLIEQLSLEMV